MNNLGKTNCWLVLIISFIVISLLIVAGIFMLFFITGNKTPQLGEFPQNSSQLDSNTGETGTISDKIKIKLESGNVSEVTLILTNSDLSALITETAQSQEKSPLKDIMVICNADSTIDMTATVQDLSKYVNKSDTHHIVLSILESAEGKQLYSTVCIEYLGDDDFDVSITNFRIGKINVPFTQQLLSSMAKELEAKLEKLSSTFSSLILDDFKVEKGRIVLSYGTNE